MFPFGIIFFRALIIFPLNNKSPCGASLIKVVTCTHCVCRIKFHTCSFFSEPYRWIQSLWLASLPVHFMKKFGSHSWGLHPPHPPYPICHHFLMVSSPNYVLNPFPSFSQPNSHHLLPEPLQKSPAVSPHLLSPNHSFPREWFVKAQIWHITSPEITPLSFLMHLE